MIYEREHPFTRQVISVWDGITDGSRIDKTIWRPGAWDIDGIYLDDACAVAHGIGMVRFEAVGEYKPKGYPTRVFYTRQFITPDGDDLKKSGLLVKVKYSFEKMVVEFPFDFELVLDAGPMVS